MGAICIFNLLAYLTSLKKDSKFLAKRNWMIFSFLFYSSMTTGIWWNSCSIQCLRGEEELISTFRLLKSNPSLISNLSRNKDLQWPFDVKLLTRVSLPNKLIKQKSFGVQKLMSGATTDSDLDNTSATKFSFRVICNSISWSNNLNKQCWCSGVWMSLIYQILYYFIVCLKNDLLPGRYCLHFFTVDAIAYDSPIYVEACCIWGENFLLYKAIGWC